MTAIPTLSQRLQLCKSRVAVFDQDKALKFAKKAIKHHSDEAQAILGLFYVTGSGVPKDLGEGLSG